MSIYNIVIPVVIVFTLLLVVYKFFTKSIDNKKKELKEWKKGDKLILTSLWYSELKNVNQSYGELKGWDYEHVYVMFGQNIKQLNHSDIKHNKSWIWRENYKKCKNFMGESPDFKEEILDEGWKTDDDSPTKDMIHGKYISELSETECQVYLKECLENEEYELAEMIKKQMEKFR